MSTVYLLCLGACLAYILKCELGSRHYYRDCEFDGSLFAALVVMHRDQCDRCSVPVSAEYNEQWNSWTLHILFEPGTFVFHHC